MEGEGTLKVLSPRPYCHAGMRERTFKIIGLSEILGFLFLVIFIIFHVTTFKISNDN